MQVVAALRSALGTSMRRPVSRRLDVWRHKLMGLSVRLFASP